MTEIDALRAEIRAIDEQLLGLLHRRNEAARRIGSIKRDANLPLQNFEVEKAVLDHALEVGARLGVHPETVRGLVRLLIQGSLRVQEGDKDGKVAKTGRTALVVGGAGLMGTWFCRFLEERGYDVFVDDPKPSNFPAGRLADRAYDLVIVATPPSTLPSVLERLGKDLPPKSTLLDIGSVKGAGADVLRRLAKTGKHVTSLHPMFGPRTDLLMGRNVLVLDAGDAAAAATAAELFARTAARTQRLPLVEHDPLMAEVLTLAHATSLAFNGALARGGRPFQELDRVASTTFLRQVEVSREVASENPRLYFEIQALNPASDGVLGRLEESVHRLREIVRARDEPGFVRYMEEGKRVYGGAT